MPPEQPGDGGVGFSWFAIELVSVHVEPDVPVAFRFQAEVDLTGLVPIPAPQVPDFKVGGGEHFVAGPIDIRKEVEFRFPGVVEIPAAVPVGFRFSGSFEFARSVEFAAQGVTSAARPVEFSFGSQREPAHRWVQALREDEELMEILLAG